MSWNKLNIKQIKDKLYEIHGSEISLDESTYISMSKPAKFIDKDYGEWWGYPNNIINKKTKHRKRMAIINGLKCRKTIEDCHKLAKQKNGKCLSIKYITSNNYYKWQCEKKHVWQARYYNIQSGKWCPKCALLNKKPHNEQTKKKISQANMGHKNGMYGRTHTTEAKKKISEHSLKCWQNEEFRNTIVNHPNRIKWCRQGALARLENNKDERFFNTKPEKMMKDILNELNISYKHGYSVWNIEHIYQADFYLYDYNIIIEVDGKYWHNFPIGLEIDKLRTKEMKKVGYKVLRFWENEFSIYSVKEQLNKIGIN